MGGNQIFLCLFLTICCCAVKAKPAEKEKDAGMKLYSSENVDDLDKQKTKRLAKYLSSYGYTSYYTERKSDLKESIKDLQYFGGLVVTGELDSTTEELMQKNRCGIKDPNVRGKRLGRGGRFRRYNLQGSKWEKEVLTWRYEHDKNSYNAWRWNNPEGLREDDVRNVMKRAMGLWERHTNIKFVEDRSSAEPDVWVKFVRRRHANDPFPFDGPGGTLAHAFYPLNNQGLAGDVHFDDDEVFSIGKTNRYYAKDLNWVAVHELGHTLGLDHSRVQDAIMYPWYTGYQENIQLKYDDIRGVQRLYGGKRRPSSKVIPPNKRCPKTKVTAVWDYKGGKMMVATVDEKLYILNKQGKGIVHPNINSKDYYRIESPIDAVFQSNLGKSDNPLYDIVFTKDGYYIYNGFRLISGPHDFKTRESYGEMNGEFQVSPIKNLTFPERVTKIDAAMKWWPNDKVYFFSGLEYWRYDEKKGEFDHGYPLPIHLGWRGVPGNVDSAYCSYATKETFFTKGDKIYRMVERPRPVRLKSGYPKSVKEELLDCEDE